MIELDTTNMCSHLQKKLFEPDGVYYPIWQAMQDDETLTAVVRSRQLHIYRGGKKILVLAGKAQPKEQREQKPSWDYAESRLRKTKSTEENKGR